MVRWFTSGTKRWTLFHRFDSPNLSPRWWLHSEARHPSRGFTVDFEPVDAQTEPVRHGEVSAVVEPRSLN
eukprot:COSAG01_NODE_699_length_14176_cov_21.100590_15_plen_70_part_00